MIKKIGYAVLALGAFGAAFFLLKAPQGSHEESEEEQPLRHHVEMSKEKAELHGITVETAGPGTIAFNVTSRGKVIMHPDLVAHILPKVPGIAMEAFKNRGDSVKKGEIIAILECREIADAKAEYLAAMQRQQLADTFYEKENRLYEKKVTSEQDLLQAKSHLEEANINVKLARQHLHSLGLNKREIDQIMDQNDEEFRYYVIRSPLNGTVIARDITRGEYIEEKSPIYEIADLSSVWVDIGVFPKDIHLIKEGAIVDISCPQMKEPSQGKLVFISPVIDEGTIAAKAIAELDNQEGKWRPGTFVQAEIATETKEAPIVIVKEAVQVIEGKPVVFLESPDGFQMHEVEIGASDSKNIEVISGLNFGDKYAATQTFLLKADLGKDSVEDD